MSFHKLTLTGGEAGHRAHMRRAGLLHLSSSLTTHSLIDLTSALMSHTPSASGWARFHHRPNELNVKAVYPHPSLDPRSMFLDERTAPPEAYIEELPNQDLSMSKSDSMEKLLGAFTNAEVSGYKTVVGVPDATPSLLRTSYPIALSHHSLRSARSRDTLRPPSGCSQGGCEARIFELMDEDESDDVKTIEGDRFDDEPMSEHCEALCEASQSDNMSLCSVLGSVGD
jgi:hypothetical protein